MLCVSKARSGLILSCEILQLTPAFSVDFKYRYFGMDNKGLSKETLASKNPLKLFELWVQKARNTPAIVHPSAMSLSTVRKDGRPSSRMVLLQSFDEKGLKFYSGRTSAKAEHIESTPFVALLFYWQPLDRSVRIEGKIEMVPSDEADLDFTNIARASQLAMHVSEKQSQFVESRDVLTAKWQQISALYADKPVPRPEFFQGFRVIPDRVEFWQMHPDTMVNDRILFTKAPLPDDYSEGEDGWKYLRLVP